MQWQSAMGNNQTRCSMTLTTDEETLLGFRKTSKDHEANHHKEEEH